MILFLANHNIFLQSANITHQHLQRQIRAEEDTVEYQLAIHSSCNSYYGTQTSYVYLKLIYMEKLPGLTQINRHDSIIESGFWSTELV